MKDIELWKGDCLELMKNIEDKSIDLILCDLPYGTTACKWDVVIPFDKLWEQYKRVIKDNGAIVLFGTEPFSSQLRCSNLKDYRYDWVWDKGSNSNPLLAKIQPLRVYELISVFYKKQCTYNPQKTKGTPYKRDYGKKHINAITNVELKSNNNDDGLRYPINILSIPLPRNNRKRLHPTEKPVALLEYLIKTYTNENDLILDNTMGSGSTGVACVNTNRRFIGIEKDEKFFEIAKERITSVGGDSK